MHLARITQLPPMQRSKLCSTPAESSLSSGEVGLTEEKGLRPGELDVRSAFFDARGKYTRYSVTACLGAVATWRL